MGEAMKNMDELQKQSLKKLLIWMITLGVMIGTLYIIGAFSSSKSDTLKKEVVNEDKELTTSDKLTLLNNSDFKYQYKIYKNEEEIILSGEKVDNVFTGFKETQDSIIKYKIIEKHVYEIKLEDEEEIYTLYDDIDSSLLDLNNISSLINQVLDKDIIKTYEDKTTTSDYNLVNNEEELEISITEDDTSIIKIIIKRGFETYELYYS
jgi:hypothetical protein